MEGEMPWRHLPVGGPSYLEMQETASEIFVILPTGRSEIA